MRYTVVWKPIAETELAEIYLATDDRAAISEAADRIDTLLSRDPLRYGKPRFDDIYVMRVSPLGVEFRVAELDRRVTIIAIWETGSPSVD